MTQNQYLGTDLTPIVEAESPEEFNAELISALFQISANDFPTRATLLAKLIAGRLPELVGLQEVFSFECLSGEIPCVALPPDIQGAFNNHEELTMAALSALGESYYVAARVANLNITLPVFLAATENPSFYVTVVDHDVILRRSDVTTQTLDGSFNKGGLCGVPIPNPFPLGPNPLKSVISEDGCNYSIVAAATPVGITIPILRGFVGVDATLEGGDTYRFINTHLEVQQPASGNPASAIFQSAQAFELLATLLAVPSSNTDIVVGDINSSSEDLPVGSIVPPYAEFVAAGYTDAWTVTGNVPGYSCCQESDLSNHSSILDERIDVIFSSKPPEKAKKKRVLGDNIPDKSAPDGLWPSDHGSVAVQLEFEQ